MKNILLIFCTLFCSFGLYAQNSSTLSWRDFKGKPKLRASEPSNLAYKMCYKLKSIHFHDTVVHKYLAYSQLKPHKSWVLPEYKTPTHLKYEQVIHNLVQLQIQRFKMNISGNQVVLGGLIQMKHEYRFEANRQIAEFKQLSQYGLDTMVVENWLKKTNGQIVKEQPFMMPNFAKENMGVGEYLLIGGGMFTNGLGTYFSPYAISVNLGLEFVFKQHLFVLENMFGYAKMKKKYGESVSIWGEGNKIAIAMPSLSYGYILLDNEKHKLSPFIGMGIMGISPNTRDSSIIAQHISMANYTILGGMSYDYKFKKTLMLSSVYDDRVRKYNYLFNEFSIRTRFYVTKANFNSTLNGFSLNFSVGISGFMRSVRLLPSS